MNSEARTFTEALREKYCDSDDTSSVQSNFITITIHGKPKDSSNGAELGFLRNVVLTNCNISNAGLPKNGLHTLCPNVIDLDLSQNVLHCWSEVLAIAQQLPLLKYLNIGSNRISQGMEYLEAHTTQHPSLSVQHMNLNETKVSWEELSRLGRIMPRLEEIHLCNNGYTHVTNLDEEVFSSLKCLMLNDNKITSWTEIWKFSQLPELKRLVLSGNPLKGIFYSASSSSPAVKSHELVGAILEDVIQHVSNEEEAGIWDICHSVLSDIMDTVDQERCNEGSDTLENKSKTARKRDQGNDTSSCDSTCQAVMTENPMNSPAGSNEAQCNENHKGDGDSGIQHDTINKSATLPNIQSTETAHDATETMDIETVSLKDQDPMDPSGQNSDKETHVANRVIRPPFASLDTLVLSSTGVDHWDEIAALTLFPALKTLRISEIKLLQELPKEDKRKLFIASLPNITILNGSEVSASEREKSERHFLRHFHDSDDKPPVFHALEKRHGKLKPVQTIDIGFGYQEWPELKFVHNGNLIRSQVVHAVEPLGKLRKFIAKELLDVPLRSVHLYHLACSAFHDNDGECEFNDLVTDGLPMSRFNLFDGDEIHIEVRGLPRKYVLNSLKRE